MWDVRDGLREGLKGVAWKNQDGNWGAMTVKGRVAAKEGGRVLRFELWKEWEMGNRR